METRHKPLTEEQRVTVRACMARAFTSISLEGWWENHPVPPRPAPGAVYCHTCQRYQDPGKLCELANTGEE